MKDIKEDNIKERLFCDVLPQVLKPVRYAGGELYSALPKENAVDFAFAFPDTYEVGMSHLGMKILYGLLNDLPGVSCERVFAPLPDMAKALGDAGLPLYTLESYRPVKNYDFVGFSLQYEMCLTNVLYMLKLSGIPLTARERAEDDPLVIAGGPCTVNPEPFCDIFDLMVIGEGEEVLPRLMELYREKKDEGRQAFLLAASGLAGVYVPSLYEVEYAQDGKIISRRTLNGAPEVVKRVYVKDMNTAFYPPTVVVPFTEPVHDRVMVEVMRGCPRGCRFCQAGFIYRPVRQKSLQTVKEQTDRLLTSTGYEQASFSSLSTTDYKGCAEAIHYVMEAYEKDSVSVSLPSLRIDKFSVDMVKEIQKNKPGTLTFAPEAGSQRMRDVINKNVSEEDILTTLKEAFTGGFSKIKLYFMMGLPHETKEDVLAIAALVDKIVDLYFSLRLKGKMLALSVSVSCFVPKPFTPFEFVGQDAKEAFDEKQRLLRDAMHRKVKFSYHDASLSVLEGAFARGDRRLNKVLLRAFENGCYFDSWPDYYNLAGWEEAFEQCGLDYHALAQRKFDYDDILPWDFIDIGVDKAYLVKEAKKADEAATTPNCYEQCGSCGINKEYGRCSFEI